MKQATAADIKQQQAVMTDYWLWLKKYRFINNNEWDLAVQELNQITDKHGCRFAGQIAIAVLDELERVVANT